MNSDMLAADGTGATPEVVWWAFEVFILLKFVSIVRMSFLSSISYF